MQAKKYLPTLLATLSLLLGGLPVIVTATPATAAVTTIPNLPAKWKTITSPASGTTCAVALNGTLWCWGKAEGTRGVTWNVANGDPEAGNPVGPKQVGAATNWVSVEGSTTHVCARNTLSEIWCWGENANGQLGDGTTNKSQVPVKVKGPIGKAWYSFSVNYQTSCGIQATGLWCWGNNSSGAILPDSSKDAVINIPRQYTAATPVIDSSAEVQIGATQAVKIGGKIYVNKGGLTLEEFTAPLGKVWNSFSVRQTFAYGSDLGSFKDFSDYASICAISSDGIALCESTFSMSDSRQMRLGAYTDWQNISLRQVDPREPICGIRGTNPKSISCFSAYAAGNVTYVGTCVDVDIRKYMGEKYNSNLTNGTKLVPSSEWCGYGGIQRVTHPFFDGTLPDSKSLDLVLPDASSVASIYGGFYQGSVAGETWYNTWGRLFALTDSGLLYVIGDGKYGERQDGLSNSLVTDTWAQALTQSPTIASVSRTMIPKTGGATVTLNGSFLVGLTSLTVGSTSISTWTESNDGTSLTFTSPTSATSATVSVTAVTAGGTATLDNALTFGDSPTAPSITGLSANDQSVTVNWSAPASVGTSPINSYIVTLSPGGSTCTWTLGPLSCTVTGLTNGVTYRATVRAFSNVGPGLVSASSASFVPYKSPDAPQIVSIAPGDGQITVTWSAASNNGSAITAYEVVTQPGGNSCSTSGTGTSCTISPLTNGTAYSVSIYATNDAGGGEVSTSETLITPRTLAGAPTSVSITPGDRQLSVGWRAPSSNGGSPVTSYTVTAQPGSVTCTAIAPSTSCNLLGLSNGSVYSITVVATNPAGDSVASSTVTGSPVTIPGKPTISATEPGSNSVLVRWRAPSATGGASVTSYTVVASPGGNSCSTSGAVLFCTVTGLDNGTTYSFTVTATNTAGTGSASASYNGVPATIAKLMLRREPVLSVVWSTGLHT